MFCAVALKLYSIVYKAKPKSLFRSRAGSHFYGTEYEIWADFGPVGNTEKKNWAVKYATFEFCFF